MTECRTMVSRIAIASPTKFCEKYGRNRSQKTKVVVVVAHLGQGKKRQLVLGYSL